MSEPKMDLQPVEGKASDLDALPPVIGNLLLDARQMNLLYKLAKTYANTPMVPAGYRGNADSCFVALELATRMNVSPVLVMQNLYIVEGKPSWSGQACVALVNGCGLFDPLEFVQVGTPGTPEWGCYAQAVRRSSGQIVKGTAVTLQMVVDEGWMDKRGSKWKTMPEQMFKYRAASFFARVHCPNVLMGFQTVEEIQDVHGATLSDAPQTVIKLLEDEA